ncbi:MAG TPA: BadF/BadG/BcrA/BcrD ATPase family protein [Bryobacteraceae bacterium]|jgi:N-acetylglucosamine kinase-like BadF-type ATPase|nr:BadF/BadG/BcrA/BcrD ATPase family protein [Bryobacteraceae bacterium]
MAEFFLGVDGGQSSTTALLGDENGVVVGRGTAGPCNHVAASEGRAKLISAIEGSLAGACAAAGIERAGLALRAACLGLSGGPEDKEEIVRDLLRAAQLRVTNDAWIALAGATAGRPGIVVIAGTGSIALGRNGGKTARAGGWGYIFGDEGAGFDIARQALRAALRFEEGWGPETSLLARLLEKANAGNANELLHRLYTPEFSRPAIARLSRLVEEEAEAGDRVSRSILHQSAVELAALAMAVRRQLFVPGEVADIAYAGGVFRGEILFHRFRDELERAGANRCLAPIHGPAAGALLEAYGLAGRRVVLSQVPEEKL